MPDESPDPLNIQPPEDWQVCAVCGLPLSRRTDREVTVGWQHSQDRDKDHVIVPVNVRDIVWRQRCDFCNSEAGVEFAVMCHDFNIPYSGSRSIGTWTACGDCGRLVVKGEWGRLVTRVKHVGPPRSQRTPRRQLNAIYGEVQRNMIGVITIEEWRERTGLRTS